MSKDLREMWKSVPGLGGHYEVSNLGGVRSKDRVVTKRTRYGGVMTQKYTGRALKPTIEKGYQRVHLSVDGKKIKMQIHTLVLLAFHGLPLQGQIGRHLNGDSLDNRPENLAWGSHLENMADRKAHGRYLIGEEHRMAKISDKAANEIKKSTESGRHLSKRYGIGESQISRIRRGESRNQSHNVLDVKVGVGL